MSGSGAETITATAAQEEFFARPMYTVHVEGWPSDQIHPSHPLERPRTAPSGARLRLWETDPRDGRHIPPPNGSGALLEVAEFSLANSGNRTLQAPKRSWKVDLGDGEVAGMSCLNLKSMYNDPSQMREALAWWLFRCSGVPASRHTYARLGINGTYLGLFSVIEQVDKAFLRAHFAGRPRGNLYKVYCGELGGGTLEHRAGPDGDDSGRQYLTPGTDDQTYRLKSFAHAGGAEGYDDLASFIRVLNGIGLPGGDERFDSDGFADSVRRVFAVEEFLRWASVNVLVGAWDNYFATPANYYLYNSGKSGNGGGAGDGEGDLVADPYVTFIPWDYDNTFGIDYFGTSWQYTNLVDWPSNTVEYWRRNGHGGTSHIPLVRNLLRNRTFRRYYLDHLEHLLDTVFNPDSIDSMIGTETAGLWARVRSAAYLESDTPNGWPFTGRQYTNDEVYHSAFKQYELRHGETFVLGIHHYVRMRYDRARQQLALLRQTDPAGSSGASFPAEPTAVPG